MLLTVNLMSYERETLEHFLCGFVLDKLCEFKNAEKKKKRTENISFLYLVGKLSKLSKLFVANAVFCNICGFSFALKN